MAANTEQLKKELSAKAEGTKEPAKLKKSMSIEELIKAMEPQVKKALPEVMTAERFTRLALSTLNTVQQLRECTQLSFLSALMQAAQLGLEPNTVLGECYLVPFNRHGQMVCEFQIGYKGLLNLAYRNPDIQMVSAQVVYEQDDFDYELGLHPRLIHRPALTDRGEIKLFYSVVQLKSGGGIFEVMSKEDMDLHAEKYSKGCNATMV